MNCSEEEVSFHPLNFTSFTRCCSFQLTKTNVFQLNILIPLIEILDVYVTLKEEFSPDEFCIHLFVKERPKEKCKPYFNPVRKRFNNVEEFKVKFI